MMDEKPSYNVSGVSVGNKSHFHQGNVHHTAPVRKTQHFHGPVTQHAPEEQGLKRRRVLDWIASTSATIQQENVFAKHGEGTGQWFLESKQYQSWLSKPGKILYCPGIPGAGKTVLASIVADDVRRKFERQDNIGTASLFCDYKMQQEQKYEGLLRSLLRQLTEQRADIPTCVQDLYKRHESKSTRPTVMDILRVTRSVVDAHSMVFIIIDALDECVMLERERLLEIILAMQKSGKVSVMTTSRILPEFETRFVDGQRLEIRASEDDVRRYFHSRVRGMPFCIKKHQALQEEILNDLLKASNGMFLLVQLYLDTLQTKTSVGDVRTTLRDLPRGKYALKDAYKEAVERIEVQPKEQQELAKKTLTLIVHSERLLWCRELQHALSIKTGDTKINPEACPELEDIASFCKGLVIVDKRSPVIRLAHLTTQEYLEQVQLEWLPNRHTELAERCLSYLILDEFKNGACSVYECYARLHNYPFLGYAAIYWGHHVRKASENSLLELVTNFLSRPTNVASSHQAHLVHRRERFISEHPNIPIFDSTLRPFQWNTFHGANLTPPAELDQTTDPRGHNFSGTSGIHLAAYYGLKEAISALLQNGCSVNLENEDHKTPLFIAASKGHEEVVQLLLAHKDIDVDTRVVSKKTPLFEVVEHGHEGVVSLLLARNDVQADPRDDSDLSPLMRASMLGHTMIVELLVSREDVDVNVRDIMGRSPLSFASSMGSPKMVELLLVRADLETNSRDVHGCTPLSYAAAAGHVAVVRQLLEQGEIDANPINENGWTPLIMAMEHQHEKIMKLLLSRKDVNANTKIFRWEKAKVKVLFARTCGGRNNLMVQAVMTPLVLAVLYQKNAMVKTLVQRADIDVNLAVEEGLTVLSLTTRFGNYTLVKMLLEQPSINMNLQDEYGDSPLTWAVTLGHEKVVGLLLERRDLDVNLTNNVGLDALSFAIGRHNLEAFKLLTSRSDLEPRLGSVDVTTISDLSATINNHIAEVLDSVSDYCNKCAGRFGAGRTHG